jgi:hypothetical protein
MTLRELTQNPFVSCSHTVICHRYRHGPYANIISGLIYVLIRFLETGVVPVVNMSLGGPADWALDFVVLILINAGVHVVVRTNSFHGVWCLSEHSTNNIRLLQETVQVGTQKTQDSIVLLESNKPSPLAQPQLMMQCGTSPAEVPVLTSSLQGIT